jgi:Rrf2 family protein
MAGRGEWDSATAGQGMLDRSFWAGARLRGELVAEHRFVHLACGAVKLSVKSDYAARAVLALARQFPSGKACKVDELAEVYDIPANYLVQILIELKSRHLVRSLRGKEGGYLLAKPPAEITMGDVLRSVYGQVFDSPAIGDTACPPELRGAWESLKSAMEGAADAINFQHLLDLGSEKDRMYYI